MKVFLLILSILCIGCSHPYLKSGVVAVNSRNVTFVESNTHVNADVQTIPEPYVAFGGSLSCYKPLRLELSYNHQNIDIDNVTYATTNGTWSGEPSGHIRMNQFMVDLYYDFLNSSSFTPYFTCGIGVTNARLTNLDVPYLGPAQRITYSEVTLPYQAGIGMDFALTDQWSLDFIFKHQWLQNGPLDLNFKTYNYGGAIKFRW